MLAEELGYADTVGSLKYSQSFLTIRPVSVSRGHQKGAITSDHSVNGLDRRGPEQLSPCVSEASLSFGISDSGVVGERWFARKTERRVGVNIAKGRWGNGQQLLPS